MGLSTTVLDKMPQVGELDWDTALGFGAAEALRAAWRLTVSVTHSPSLKTLVWKAMSKIP
jgi:hypothetical protein